MYSLIIDTMTLVHVQLHSNVLKAAAITKTDGEMKGSLGMISMLKFLKKQ